MVIFGNEWTMRCVTITSNVVPWVWIGRTLALRTKILPSSALPGAKLSIVVDGDGYYRHFSIDGKECINGGHPATMKGLRRLRADR
jgi:hypothetical protein